MADILTKSDLVKLKNDVSKATSDEFKPYLSESTDLFFNNCVRSLRFMLSEKENIFFALLQWASIGIGYYLWVQMLDWIPDDIWQNIRNDNTDSGAGIADLILLLWSFICVGITSFPIGFFTACMGASFILRFNGQKSTVLNCVHLVMNRLWSIWLFSWVDGWWTVNRILDRLPKKDDKTSSAKKALNEALYQAWKLATLGFLPAIISGRSLSDACKDTILITKDRFGDLAKLRLAYSAICWIFGIGSYVLFIYIVLNSPHLLNKENQIYNFYVLAGLPMLFALTFIMMLFRPLYIISAFRIYANYMRDRRIQITLPKKSFAYTALIAFILLSILVGAAYIYRNELGIIEILSSYENYIDK